MTPTPAAESLMSRARLRLILTAALFAAWIGWLAFLAVTTTRPVVLKRPQFLASQLDVIATLTDGGGGGRPAPTVTVDEVAWPKEEAVKLKGQAIKVANLPLLTKEDGWEGPGQYILALAKNGDYHVAAVAPSPGLLERNARPRIYRATPQTLQQLREIRPSPPPHPND